MHIEMKIWAHRGCSQQYPENTLLSFEKAADINGLTGIELDIQMTKDGEIVVIHDEKVDRTTGGLGYVKDYSISELRKLNIQYTAAAHQKIPVMEEVLDLLKDRMANGLKINIELKNSLIPYQGMEEKIVDLVHKKGVQDNIIYSSFYAKSLQNLQRLDSNAEIGILDLKVSDCMYKLQGGCGAVALHPFWQGIDLSAKELEGYAVRAWFTGLLYPEKSTGRLLDLSKLEYQGITDVFLNEPEMYL